jgi:hypothetical protein
VTEQLLAQQLESPSGTGRDDPEATTQYVFNEQPSNGLPLTDPFSLGILRLVDGRRSRRE